jgi:misacylated tRNA(Ala) deacylase
MKAMYLEDSYLSHFSARVQRLQGGCIILDKTAFYPQSGGQPSDMGSMIKDGDIFKVAGTSISEGEILHCLDREGLIEGDEVICSIDWARRYRLMRSHTACHVLSAVIFKETGAKITGNQIDLARSRVDFNLDDFNKSEIAGYVEKANQIFDQGLPVKTSVVQRAQALSMPDLFRLAMDVPDREEVRIVQIEGLDLQACGGTHVRSTAEVGGIKMAKAENKGKSNRRVYFELLDGVASCM